MPSLFERLYPGVPTPARTPAGQPVAHLKPPQTLLERICTPRRKEHVQAQSTLG